MQQKHTNGDDLAAEELRREVLHIGGRRIVTAPGLLIPDPTTDSGRGRLNRRRR